MAKRGRKPVRVVPKPAGDGWDAPLHLSAEALVAWHHVVALLANAGKLGRTDPTLVEAYAVNMAMLREAQAAIKEHGITIRSAANGLTANPACAIVNAASMRLKAIIDSFGAIAGTDGAKSQDKSKWGDVFGAAV